LLYPQPRGGKGINDIKGDPKLNSAVPSFIGYYNKNLKYTSKFACGGFPALPASKRTKLKAGQQVNVRFYTADMGKDKKLLAKQFNPKKVRKIEQARHGGGTCEFSLSYDNGKSFFRIGRYTKSCPDVMYEWPVRIPKNVPACEHQGCLFVWSWTAHLIDQYYHNCADIRLSSSVPYNKNKYPKGKIDIYDFKGYRRGVTAPGDGLKKKYQYGKGPSSTEIKDNLNGKYVNKL
jgi:hypothetical protein